MLFIAMRSERHGESVKRHLPADIFYRGQDAAVISQRRMKHIQETIERSLTAAKSATVQARGRNGLRLIETR